MESLAEKLSNVSREHRAALICLPDSGERDVIKQLAQKPRWDGDLNSKHGRDLLVEKGLAARWNGFNFLTQSGYAVVDSLWGLEKFSKP